MFDCSGLRVRRGLFIQIFLVVALTVALSAQEENPNAGTIQGTVRDDVGAPVAGARVLYSSQATDTRGATRSDKDGKYVSEAVPPGVYVVRVEGRDMIPVDTSVTVAKERLSRRISSWNGLVPARCGWRANSVGTLQTSCRLTVVTI